MRKNIRYNVHSFSVKEKERCFMIYYALLAASSLLFALQFLFFQKFQKVAGAGLDASLSFSFYSALLCLPFLFAINGFCLGFSVPTLLCGFALAVIALLYDFASIRSLQTVNLALYSVFAMLGGMALPFVYGICFLGEPLTAAKLVCFLAIAVSVFLTLSELPLANRKAIVWYVLVFFINGMSSVVSSIHQNTAGTVDSNSFLFYGKLFCAIFALIWQLARSKRLLPLPKAALGSCGAYSIFHSTASLLMLIALRHLPSSVQFPIITGGTMFFSSMVGLFRGEKLKLRSTASLVLAVAASVIIAL